MTTENRKIKIFILDDDRYHGLFLKNALACDKYQIDYFENEQRCIKELSTLPDILILDHRLEYLTGLEVLEEVKRSCQGKTQVIYLSAQEHVHVAIKALKEGAITYVEKGVNAVEAINDAIDQIIELTNDFKIQLDLSKFRRDEF